MRSLAEHALNNATLALMGVTFVNSFFRRMAGQLPTEIPSYTVYLDDKSDARLEIAEILKDEPKSFVVVIRDQNAQLEEVIFVPNADECKNVVKTDSTYCFHETKMYDAPALRQLSFLRRGRLKKEHAHPKKSTLTGVITNKEK